MSAPPRPRFDVSRDPWIPCETLAGRAIELGVEDALLRAHELAAVHDESPLATAVIHRLLLAILHRVVDGPRSIEGWTALWNQDRFDADRVRDYLGRWRHRFDLFDPDRPFLQVPRLAEVICDERGGKVTKAIPARRLALECSSYAGAANLLEHGGDDEGLTPAAALRAMLGFLGFGPGGRILNDAAHPNACPLRAGAVALARGETLHRTLLLNLLVIGRDRPVPRGDDDAPAWEQKVPAQREARAARGWLDALTWQARRVHLIPDTSGAVVKTAVTGFGTESEGPWIEPMHALFVRDPKRGPEAVRFDPDRITWRDATALFQAAGPADQHRRPAVCSQIAELVEADVLSRDQLFSIDLYGLASSQAAIGLWGAEHMPLPARLLTDPERLGSVKAALTAAEDVASAVRGSTWLLAKVALAPGDRSPDKKDIAALAARLDAPSRYWAALGARFDALLRGLGAVDDDEPVLAAWKAAARGAAFRALVDAGRQLGATARALQARALAERHLSRGLGEALPAPAPAKEELVHD
jgi:CRISPR system Cascade subunit CasA